MEETDKEIKAEGSEEGREGKKREKVKKVGANS